MLTRETEIVESEGTTFLSLRFLHFSSDHRGRAFKKNQKNSRQEKII